MFLFIPFYSTQKSDEMGIKKERIGRSVGASSDELTRVGYKQGYVDVLYTMGSRTNVRVGSGISEKFEERVGVH